MLFRSVFAKRAAEDIAMKGIIPQQETDLFAAVNVKYYENYGAVIEEHYRAVRMAISKADE